MTKINYLKYEDLKVGMEVTSKELERIYDTYIVLSNAKLLQEKRYCTMKGTIKEFGKDVLCAVEEDEVLVYYSSLEAMENDLY